MPNNPNQKKCPTCDGADHGCFFLTDCPDCGGSGLASSIDKDIQGELEQQVRQICTYYSELGEGTAGYCLSEDQFKKLFTLLTQTRRQADAAGYERGQREMRDRIVQEIKDYSLPIENGRWMLNSLVEGLAALKPQSTKEQSNGE